MNIPFDIIAVLFAKNIFGIATDDELKLIRLWENESKDNAEFYDKSIVPGISESLVIMKGCKKTKIAVKRIIEKVASR